MFEYIRDVYRSIRDNYRSYSSNPKTQKTQKKGGRFYAFFRAFFGYILGWPKPITLSEEQRDKFKNGLDSKLSSDYNITYGPGVIELTPKGLAKRLS